MDAIEMFDFFHIFFTWVQGIIILLILHQYFHFLIYIESLLTNNKISERFSVNKKKLLSQNEFDFFCSF